MDDLYANDALQRAKIENRPTGKAVGVLASKGGIGKSTLTLWIAEAMYHASGGSVAVVDANLDNPTLLYVTSSWWGKTLGIAGLIPHEDGQPPTSKQIDEVMVPVKGLGSLLGGPQHPRQFQTKIVARILKYVIADLRTKFEWVFVDLPVAGTNTVMLTDFALQKQIFNQYLAIFSTENSDIYSVSKWFMDQFKPPEQGGVSLDPKKCCAIINKSDATQLETEPLRTKIEQNLHMPVVGNVPVAENYASLRNDLKWQCPPELQSYISEICHNAFGVTGSNTSTTEQTRRSKRISRRRRKKARRAD